MNLAHDRELGADDPQAAMVAPWQPGRTLAFAALGTRCAIDLIGAHNLQGLAGATADGGTWTVCNGNIRAALRLPGQPARRPIAASTDEGMVPQ